MKGWKILLLVLAGVAASLVLLVWFLPARWVVSRMEARLHGAQLLQVEGSVWNGRAAQLMTADGQSLGQLQWQLSRRLLLGEVVLHVELDGPMARFRGDLSRHGDLAQWHDVHAQLVLDAMEPPPRTAWGEPRGTLTLTAEQAQVRAGWPESLRAAVHWNDVAMRVDQRDLLLGPLSAELTGSHGVISAHVHDDGAGPLHLQGQLQISPLGWRLVGELAARDNDPALQRWMASFGTPDAQGIIHLQRGAGLGATPAASGVSR